MEYERYFRWLSMLACGSLVMENSELLLTLWNTGYIFNYDIDKDRNLDGLSLRARYVEETGDYEVPVTDDLSACNCLEALTAIACRCDLISGDPEVENVSKWFRILIDNLVGPGASVNDISLALNRWMNRQYAPNGRGGLFPLRNPAHDQRFIPTWNQMCSYLSEK